MRTRFQQSIVDAKLVETRDGAAARPIERAYVTHGGALLALRDGIGAGLKWSARALYVAPLLVIVRLVMHAVDARKGELVVAAFVCLVLLFFVMLSFYMLAAFVAWGQRARSGLVRPNADDVDTEGNEDADHADTGQIVKIKGRVVRLTPGDAGALVRDFWRQELRVTEAEVFGVVREAGAPVVVLVTTAPFVLGAQREESAGEALTKTTVDRTDVLAEQKGHVTKVEIGDTVTVTGQLLDRIQNAAEFELDGEMLRFSIGQNEGDVPYREGAMQGALLVSDTKELPITISVTTT